MTGLEPKLARLPRLDAGTRFAPIGRGGFRYLLRKDPQKKAPRKRGFKKGGPEKAVLKKALYRGGLYGSPSQ